MFGSLPTMKSLTDGSARTTACAYCTNWLRSASVTGVFAPLTLWMTTIVRTPSCEAAAAAFCSAVSSAGGGEVIPFDHIAVSRIVSNPTFFARSYFRFAALASASLPLSSARSEEHTSELQSRRDLVCRLLLENKKHSNGTLLRRMF